MDMPPAPLLDRMRDLRRAVLELDAELQRTGLENLTPTTRNWLLDETERTVRDFGMLHKVARVDSKDVELQITHRRLRTGASL